MLVVAVAVERLLELVVQVVAAMVETTAMALQESQTQAVVAGVLMTKVLAVVQAAQAALVSSSFRQITHLLSM